jgi:hypothetical protein
MPSAWIQHIKDFAAKNNLSYSCSMTDPECKATYVPVKKAKKPTKTSLKKRSQLAIMTDTFDL